MRPRDALEQIRATTVAAMHEQALVALEPLLTYDRVHGGDLLRTLAVYLANGQNASKTAMALYLHRSGLLYRLGRIEGLLGVRLDSFQDRVALEVAVLALNEETGDWFG